MNKVYMTDRCTKCVNGKAYNPMLKTYKKCHVCGGTGKIKKFGWYEKDDKCPIDCKGCPDEIKKDCVDAGVVLPPYNEESAENTISAPLTADWAIVTLTRLKYPDHKVKVTDKGVELIHEGDIPKARNEQDVNATLALQCYAMIGQAYRAGTLKL